eukprot:TRINITY_DN16446_c0_g1_i1.p1 TRINITY_DN16446_c0_g1~~TRINITY_DN16446_c0_g1_i1.p1  ORF type:complete len:232 (-),score=67.51 TRINITY_DN16446_c0_g1_i1:125-766(-)
MKHIFGSSKPKTPAPTLEDSSSILEKRGDVLDAKIAKLDKELLEYKQKMAKQRPGPALNLLKQKAMQVLKQKKMYEQQRGVVANQQFTVDQLAFTTETTKATVDQVAAMKGAAKTLKAEMKKMKIEDIEDMQDELMDLYDDSQEIQDIMGRAYGVGEDIDEADLDAELAALGDDVGVTDDASYLDVALGGPEPAAPTAEETTDPERLEQQLGL